LGGALSSGWWPASWWETLPLSFAQALLALITSLSILLISSLAYLRARSIRSLAIKSELHQMMESMRDHVSTLFKRKAGARRVGKNAPEVHRDEALLVKKFSADVAECVQKYFRLLTGDTSVACAIRLIAKDADQPSASHYVTVARSSGLAAGREDTSQPIPSNIGIPSFMSKHSGRGLLFYYDIPKAIEKEVFHKTASEDRYKDDIVTMLVAPLRGWDGSNIRLFGLLYVTSKSRGSLCIKHFDAMGAISDALSMAYVSIFGRLHSLQVELEFPANPK
jgi:hypothetical protein